MRRHAVVTSRAARVVRGLWPDRNPLRRTIDRVEALVVAGLAVAFLAGAPLAAAAAGHLVYVFGSRTVDAQRAAWHQVPAVLLAAAPTSGYAADPEVQARWTAPDGARRTGAVLARPGQRAGSTVMVWVDAAGRLTGPPLQASQVHSQAVLAAILAPVVLGLALLCAGQLASCLLDRRRLAAWDAEWRAIGPQWTTQR